MKKTVKDASIQHVGTTLSLALMFANSHFQGSKTCQIANKNDIMKS